MRVHQLLPTLNPGDAIGNVTRRMRRIFQDWGYESEIFAENVHPSLKQEARTYTDYPKFAAPRENIVLYHFSVASPESEFFRLLWERKVLVHHNVTPARFFEPYEPHIVDVLRRSHEELTGLAPVVDGAMADSGFNRDELLQAGYRSAEVVPILLDFASLDGEADPTLLDRFNDGRTNILFVSKIAPNKGYEPLIRAFAAYRRLHDPSARLLLVGVTFSPLYRRRLDEVSDEVGRDGIHFLGGVSAAGLRACYRAATVFLCLSEHEGFGVPLVECMHLGVPIVAASGSSVTWTLGGAGLEIDSREPERVAAAVDRIVRDGAFRDRILAGQRKRLEDFREEKILPSLKRVIDEVASRPVALPRVAFVVQRYGVEVGGGSELHCRWVAEHLAPHLDVEVVTTTAKDYLTWENAYSAGEDRVNGIAIRRFPVAATRDMDSFVRESDALFARTDRTITDEVDWIVKQGPFSPALLDYLREEARGRHDYLIFFTYLYFPTVMGLQAVADRALLVPTAHDEPPFHFRIYDSVLRRPRAWFYNSEEERAMIRARLRGREHGIGLTTGVGIDFPERLDPKGFRRRRGIDGDFILYVGRVSPAKGCGQLFEFFERYKARRPGPLKLVLMGNEEIGVPRRPDVVSLGFVADGEKFDAMAASVALVNPSPMESLSMVVLEAWLSGTVVLVNGGTPVLKGHCDRSGGGVAYGTYEEFESGLTSLLQDPDGRGAMASRGRQYVESNYHWGIIIHKYLTLLRYLWLEDRGRRARATEGADGG